MSFYLSLPWEAHALEVHDIGNKTKMLQNSINYQRLPFLASLCLRSTSFKHPTSERSLDFIWSNESKQLRFENGKMSVFFTPKSWNCSREHGQTVHVRQLRWHEECTVSGLTSLISSGLTHQPSGISALPPTLQLLQPTNTWAGSFTPLPVQSPLCQMQLSDLMCQRMPTVPEQESSDCSALQMLHMWDSEAKAPY